ncbi:MAG: hypothetical protein K0U72_10130 [Gammaproteobacteria bacterium]|nr:hypothetical protein [Gammaproteobacteria bacterium]
MNAIVTAENGAIGAETIFNFSESGGVVTAEYSGGKVTQGYLVGARSGSSLKFRYCQIDSSGNIDGGESTCEIEFSGQRLVRIVERFVWASRAGGGENVLQEIVAAG